MHESPHWVTVVVFGQAAAPAPTFKNSLRDWQARYKARRAAFASLFEPATDTERESENDASLPPSGRP